MNALLVLVLVASQAAVDASVEELPQNPAPASTREEVRESRSQLVSQVPPERAPLAHLALGLGGTTLLVGGSVAALSPVFFHVEPRDEPAVRWAGVVAAGVGVSMIAVSGLLFLDDPEVVWTRTSGPVPAF